ncbi:MAG TPA: DUF1840 domain-containing protein [Gammaproteobacteria bacterium]|nr:DUF1840 domain-containing protein [Gammaproteobacteria bacterium]
MLITFKTKAYASITMFGDVGTRMLEMMDFGAAVPGAIKPEDVPAALENLEKALGKLPRQVESAGDDDDGQARVGLHTRAVPLIELLRAAIADEEYVRWE